MSAKTPWVDQSASLAAFYRMNEGSGTIVTDGSGNGNTGTLTNGPTWTTGKYGTGLLFNGTSPYVTVPNSASTNISGRAITIEFWANVQSGSGDFAVVAKPWSASSMPAPYYQYGVEYTGGANAFNFYFGDTSNAVHGGSFTIPASRNAWHHIAFTYDGASVKGYLDGSLKFTVSETASIQARGNALRFGVDGALRQAYKGSLDELRIYNRALSQAEVQADMNSQL